MKTKTYCLILKKTGYLFYLGAILAVFSIFIACGDEDDDPKLEGDKYSIADIKGNWTATQAIFSSIDVPNKGFLDIIDEGGSLTLAIQDNGRSKLTIILPGEANQVINGQLGFDEEWLAVSYDSDPGEYDYLFFELNDIKTILTIIGDGGYDFDDDGIEDLASMHFVLTRD